MSKKPEEKVYLDTNFILDCTEGRNSHSIALMEKFRTDGWECLSSSLTMMELSDTVKDTIFVNKKNGIIAILLLN